MASIDSPIPLSEIESVLAWVDTFKLSRPTKKINRDFSDAVLLAEILAVHYPKLVEMHNYPPRNSHSLKLNNWMTLNRKVLTKLKLKLCCNTMEQLANCAPGVIERVLVMVREKIRRDDEANKGKDAEQNMSSGGSYYEACGDDGPLLVTDKVDRERTSSDPSATYRVTLPENVLVVPVKTRINGVLETVQQKVVNYESYLALKEELKDALDSADVLKQKVEHLDSLLKLKEERIDELQKQLERKQLRRKEAEALVNSLCVPFETVPSPPPPQPCNEVLIYPSKTEVNPPIKPDVNPPNKTEVISTSKSNIEVNIVKTPSTKTVDKVLSVEKAKADDSKIPIKLDSTVKISNVPIKPISASAIDLDSTVKISNVSIKPISASVIDLENNLDRIKSDVFKEIEIIDERTFFNHDGEEFKDSEENTMTTIEETIQKEIKSIMNPMEFTQGMNNNY